MGWTLHDLPGGGKLGTRGGLSGVFIRFPEVTLPSTIFRPSIPEGDYKLPIPDIEIPERLLLMLAADHIRSHRISELEDASDTEILGVPIPDDDDAD